MAWTSDPVEPMKEAKDCLNKIGKLIEDKNWEWAVSYLENAVEELHMAQGACEHQMNLEKEAGTFVYQDEPE